jgi:hypothetical protein
VLESEADSEQSEDLGEKENSQICHVLRGFGLTPSNQNVFEHWIQKVKEPDLENHDMFKNLLNSSKEVLSIVMKITSEETAQFMHSSKCSTPRNLASQNFATPIFSF